MHGKSKDAMIVLKQHRIAIALMYIQVEYQKIRFTTSGYLSRSTTLAATAMSEKTRKTFSSIMKRMMRATRQMRAPTTSNSSLLPLLLLS
jgi:hypothetical protein